MLKKSEHAWFRQSNKTHLMVLLSNQYQYASCSRGDTVYEAKIWYINVLLILGTGHWWAQSPHMRTSEGAPGPWTYLYILYILLFMLFSGNLLRVCPSQEDGSLILALLQISSFPYKGCKLFLTRFEGLTRSYMCPGGSWARFLFTPQCNFSTVQ